MVLSPMEVAQETTTQMDVEDPTLDEEQAERNDWVKKMRKLVTPQEMLTSDLEIDPEYFKPRSMRNTNLPKQSDWTDKELSFLLQGIRKYGVGEYKGIQANFLMNWSEEEIANKTKELLGTNDLTFYEDSHWNGNAAQIERERAKNTRA